MQRGGTSSYYITSIKEGNSEDGHGSLKTLSQIMLFEIQSRRKVIGEERKGVPFKIFTSYELHIRLIFHLIESILLIEII